LWRTGELLKPSGRFYTLHRAILHQPSFPSLRNNSQPWNYNEKAIRRRQHINLERIEQITLNNTEQCLTKRRGIWESTTPLQIFFRDEGWWISHIQMMVTGVVYIDKRKSLVNSTYIRPGDLEVTRRVLDKMVETVGFQSLSRRRCR